MSSLDRRTFLTFGGSAAALGTLSLVGCGGGGGGVEASFAAVAAPQKGPLATASKEGIQFQVVGKSHTLTVIAADGSTRTVGGVGLTQGKLNFPVDVAILNGLVYVVEAGNHRVQVFDFKGATLGVIGQGVLNYPGGIAAGTNEIFVADSRNARVVAFNPAGEVTRILGAGVLSAPRGMEVVEGGILVADPGLRKVIKLSFNGTVMGTYGSDWVLPYDVTTDGNLVYVADVSRNELAVTDPSGAHVGAIALQAAPSNVWFRSGTLYVA